MFEPIIARYSDGEYSTIVLPNGIVETMWFGDDGEQRFISRTNSAMAAHVAAVHSDRQAR